jgi:hypothetical protein
LQEASPSTKVALMARVKVRSPDGSELAFYTNEEFSEAVGMGSVTSSWEIYHERRSLWLPIAMHPAFQSLLQSLADADGAGAEPDGFRAAM